MKKRKKDKIIVGTEVLLLFMIVGILRINAASSNPPSSEVNYNKNSQTNVQGSINDLYNKVAYGDAASSEILSGKTALVGGKKVVGTYTCATLASQTPGDAKPENMDEGKVAWVNGNKVVVVRKEIVVTNKVELGDYISYVPSKGGTFVDNGVYIPTEDYLLKLHPSRLNLWRVIRKNLDGTVELVSEYVSTEDVCIADYEKYIGKLNKVAKQYETEGITVGSRHMGYDATKAQEYLESVNENWGNRDQGYTTDVKLVEEAIGTLRAKPVGLIDDEGYFLASRYDFSTYQGGVSKSRIYTVQNGHTSYNAYNYCTHVRPIVVLSTKVKITGGDGTENNPYTLGL